MVTNTIPPLFAVAMFAVGLLAFVVGGTVLEAVGLTADDAFSIGVVFASYGVVVFADLRRRASHGYKSS